MKIIISCSERIASLGIFKYTVDSNFEKKTSVMWQIAKAHHFFLWQLRWSCALTPQRGRPRASGIHQLCILPYEPEENE